MAFLPINFPDSFLALSRNFLIYPWILPSTQEPLSIQNFGHPRLSSMKRISFLSENKWSRRTTSTLLRLRWTCLMLGSWRAEGRDSGLLDLSLFLLSISTIKQQNEMAQKMMHHMLWRGKQLWISLRGLEKQFAGSKAHMKMLKSLQGGETFHRSAAAVCVEQEVTSTLYQSVKCWRVIFFAWIGWMFGTELKKLDGSKLYRWKKWV